MGADRCIMCNQIIPEGLQVCPNCNTKRVGRLTIYYLRTGGIHEIPKGKEQEVIKFYKLFKTANGMWQNGRGDIYAWEGNDE